MQIGDIRATTVTVPLEAPLRHANGCHWGRFVRTIVEVETDNGLDRAGRNGRRRRIGRSRFPRHEAISGGPRSGAPGGDALPHRQSHGVALQQPHPGAGRAGIRLPRYSGPGLGRAGLGDSGRPPARPRAVSPPTAFSAIRIRARGAGEVRTIDQVVANVRAPEAALRVHHPQAEGRRFHAGLRAGGLPRAGRGVSRTIRCASTPTASGPPSRPSASARPSKDCATTIWRTRSSV